MSQPPDKAASDRIAGAEVAQRRERLYDLGRLRRAGQHHATALISILFKLS